MTTLIYLIGEPGAGKSTLMAAATADYSRMKVDKPIAHEYLIDSHDEAIAMELGYRRPPFSGTDTLGMSAITAAERLLSSQPFPLVLAEGARLANLRFLRTALQLDYDVHLITITTTHAAERRLRRARNLGTTQNPAWVQGAATRATNLARETLTHLPQIQQQTINTDPPTSPPAHPNTHEESWTTLKNLINSSARPGERA